MSLRLRTGPEKNNVGGLAVSKQLVGQDRSWRSVCNQSEQTYLQRFAEQ